MALGSDESVDLAQAAETCPVCKSPRPGRFCAACGERRIEPERETAGQFLIAAFEGLTNLEGRLWGSLRSFARRPGELTALYLAGKRRPYLSPVQLLFSAILLVLVLGQVIEYRLFSTHLSTQVQGSLHGSWALMVAEAEAARLGLGLEAYRERYDAMTGRLAKPLMLTFVPVSVLLSGLFLLPRRLRLIEHLTLGCHLVAWFVLFPAFLLAIACAMLTAGLQSAGVPMGDDFAREAPILLGLIGGTTWWLAAAQQRLYKIRRRGAWLRAVPWALAFLFVGGSVYRLLLFLATVWSLR